MIENLPLACNIILFLFLFLAIMRLVYLENKITTFYLKFIKIMELNENVGRPYRTLANICELVKEHFD